MQTKLDAESFFSSAAMDAERKRGSKFRLRVRDLESALIRKELLIQCAKLGRVDIRDAVPTEGISVNDKGEVVGAADAVKRHLRSI